MFQHIIRDILVSRDTNDLICNVDVVDIGLCDNDGNLINIYVLFTIIINGSAFKSKQTCKHNYVIYTMQINNNNKLQ